MAPMVCLFRLFAAFLLLALPACSSIDAEQSRLCRMLLPALFSEDEGITVMASEAASSAVHITFRTGSAEQRSQLLSCRFGGTGYSAAKRDLVAVSVNGRGLGETQLWVLKERWLESQIAIRADPGRPRADLAAIVLPRAQAVALQHAIGALPRVIILALLALSTALIYGLIGRINLAIGEFAAMGGLVMALSVTVGASLGLAAPMLAGSLGLLIVLGTMALCGHVMGQAVLVPLSSRGGQPILIAGVGLILVVQEGLRLAQGARTLWLPPVGDELIVLARSGDFEVVFSARTLSIVVSHVFLIVLVLAFMHRSRFGMAWRAVADDPLAARLMGIDHRMTLILTSLVATALAGLAGATITLLWGGMSFSGGTILGLTGLMAAILGGIGSLAGALVAAIAIGSAHALWMALFPIEHWELVSFLLLTLILVLKPGGFFGYDSGANRNI
ncbi:LivH Branched-chain amino acid ABC-type transport system, permease components [Rhabdaerophilaceae bacterium]